MNKFINTLFRYNSWLLLAMYCAISLFVLRLERDEVPKRLLSGGMELRASIAESLQQFSWRFSLKEENARLVRLNSILLAELLESKATLRNARLLEKTLADSLFDTKKYMHARVVDRVFSDRENMLIINAGKQEGVEREMTVFTPKGLVGRVIAVSDHYAKVMPLIHTSFRVSVASSGNGILGVMGWKGGREDIAFVSHVPLSSPIEKGEIMLTSGASTFAIEGIPVGRVSSIRPDRLFNIVEIALAVDFSSLTHVMLARRDKNPELLRLLKEAEPDNEQR